MKKLLLCISMLSLSIMTAQDIPIFEPTMAITGLGLIDSPVGEEVDKIIDGDIATKFLDFELGDGMGFTVDLGGVSKAAIAIEVTTANDFPERDPIDFEVLGSTDGASFTSVATGAITCIIDRFDTRRFDFTNSEGYMFYRINFTAPCDPSGGAGIPSIQLAEVQLYEPELGVDDNQLLGDQISIFPNPNNGTFTLTYTGNESLNELTVIDVTGKLVKKISLTNFNASREVQLSSIGSGIYFLNISTLNTEVTKKIIIR